MPTTLRRRNMRWRVSVLRLDIAGIMNTPVVQLPMSPHHVASVTATVKEVGQPMYMLVQVSVGVSN